MKLNMILLIQRSLINLGRTARAWKGWTVSNHYWPKRLPRRTKKTNPYCWKTYEPRRFKWLKPNQPLNSNLTSWLIRQRKGCSLNVRLSNTKEMLNLLLLQVLMGKVSAMEKRTSERCITPSIPTSNQTITKWIWPARKDTDLTE